MDKKLIPSLLLICLAIVTIFSLAFTKQNSEILTSVALVSEVAGVLWLFSKMNSYYKRVA